MKFYSLSMLMRKAKEAGLSVNRSYLVVWEQQGIIPRPDNVLVTGDGKTARPGFLGTHTGETRIYTEQEIDKIIKIIKENKS